MKPKIPPSVAPSKHGGRSVDTQKSAPKNSGQIAYGKQGGATSAKTDGGGGMGNSLPDLHKQIIGK